MVSSLRSPRFLRPVLSRSYERTPANPLLLQGTITPLDQIKRFEVTEVYAHPEATVDIVLVHGLNGHPQNTWTAKNGVFWPNELLPVTLRQAKARVLVYGYNADVYTFGSDKGASSDMLHQHAQSLLTGLSMERMSEDKEENAIIWVAHSLGGILVKRALELSNDLTSKSADPSRSIYVSTYGIIFLGTPHLGADGAKWGQVLHSLIKTVMPKKIVETEDQLLKTLQNNNETLQNINLHFLDIYQRFEIDMVHEAMRTDLKGTKVFVVDQASASPPLPGVRYYGIEGTHSSMCKFESKHAPGYLNVSTAIKGWANDCTPKIQARWAAERSARRQAKENEAKELLGIYVTDKENSLSAPVAHPQTQEAGISNSTSEPTSQQAPATSQPRAALEAAPRQAASPFQYRYTTEEVEEREAELVEHSSPAVSTANLAQPATSADPNTTTAPTAYFIKPQGFRPNSLFVGREDELEKMHRMLFDRKRRAEGVAAVLIQCIPGGGKTHLAREYVYKHLKDFPGGVFWVTAKSREQLEAGFWHIAATVALRPEGDGAVAKQTEDFVRCVIDWFTTHHDWLLVLDGIHFDHNDTLSRFIPDSTNSSLLYTSTEHSVGGDHHFMNPAVIRVPLLSAREAQELFLQELGRKNPTTDDLAEAMKLVQRMGFLPEVIHVAAKRLKSTQEPLAKFARAYASGPKLRALDTYVAVVEQLQNSGADEALNLISILAFFSSSIPVEMISLGYKAVDIPVKAYEMATGRSLNNTFKILNSYALISRSEHDLSPHASTSSKSSSHLLADDLDIIRIHSVVQDFFIDSLRAAGTRATWLARAATLFNRSYEMASQRIQAKTNAGLVGDYRSYEIHARCLLAHLARLERRGPAFPAIREPLEVSLRGIMAEIVRRTRESSLDIAKGGSEEPFMLSIFDRTSSSSDTGPETPGLADSYPPGVHLWGMDASQLESPVSVNDFPLKFPAMPEVDDGYDSDWSSNASASVIMRGSHYSIGPGIATPTNPTNTITSPITQLNSPIPTKEELPITPPRRPHTTVPRADLHRTTRALEASRYHDTTGAFRAAADPRVSLSHETAMGVLDRRGRTGNHGVEGVMGIPIPGAKGYLPSGLSAAEVALGEISKNSPPPSRGGGHIQDRGRRRSNQRRPSEMLGGKSAGWQSEAVAGDTIFEAVSSPLSTSTSGSGTGTGQKRSRSKPSPRPRPATPAVTALRGIPYEPRPSSSSSSSSATPVTQTWRDENTTSPRPPLRMYNQPYPVSTPDFAAPLPPAKYPRQTGPLPIEYSPTLSTAPVLKSDVRPHAPTTISAPTPYLYPHAPAPGPGLAPAQAPALGGAQQGSGSGSGSAQGRAYFPLMPTTPLPSRRVGGYSSQPMSRNVSGYSSAPMSRDASGGLSAQSGSGSGSGGSRRSAGSEGAGGMPVGMARGRGEVRGRRPSLAETEPPPELPRFSPETREGVDNGFGGFGGIGGFGGYN
ncbi:hypothetical protein VE03_08516 [Pseudogymnoascus sp. 23342-1-I1]|nr:hypothetical protein VE03_08516 [Pseudogymnoascus sp. 23342-1-I1]